MKKIVQLFSKRALLLCLFLISSVSWGQTATYDFSSTGAVAGVDSNPPISVDANIGFASYKNSGTADPIINSSQLRLYQNTTKGGSIKISPKNGATITSVKVYASGTTGPAKYSVNGSGTNSLSISSGVYSINSISATSGIEFWCVGNSTSTRIYVDKFEVTYTMPVTGPIVTTNAATSIATTTATFNGTVNANGLSTTNTFEYGTSVSYGSSIAATPATLNTNVATAVSAITTGLAVNTQYNYRAVAKVGGVPTNGVNTTFWTLANVPLALTVDGAQITSLNVTLNATDGNPTSTQYAIYELNTDKYVQSDGTLGVNAVWKTISGWGSQILVNSLNENTTYNFYVKARNGANTETSFDIDGASGTTLINTNPTLEVDPLNSFDAICINTSANTQILNVLGVNLTNDDVTIGPLTGFTFSIDSGVTFSNNVILNADMNGDLIGEVIVKFTPTAVQSYNGNIPVSGGGASTINVSVVGSGINTPPTISTTSSQTAITSTSATLGGTATALGCGAITERGIYYSTTSGFANGTGTKVSDTGTFIAEAFTKNVTGLTSNTNYYFKAFVTSAGGTVYSSQGAFKTLVDYCAGDHFYDAGGANSSYGNNENVTTIITPSVGNIVTVTFNSFNTEIGYDYLKVYDGPDASSPALHTGDGFSGTTNPGTFTSTHASGALTFVFTSDVSDTRDGWDATVTCNPIPTCIRPTALNTSSVTATSATLNWTASVSNPTDGYDYYYTTSATAPDGTTVASGSVAAGETSAVLSSLNSSTAYYYWIRANCGNDDYSVWEQGNSFTTLQLAAPVATAGTNVASASFTANWDAVAGATSYELDVYQVTTGGPAITTTETFTAIGGGTTSSYNTRSWTGVDGISWTAYKARTDNKITLENEAITLRNEAGSYLESGVITGGLSNISFEVQQFYSGTGGILTVKVLTGVSFNTETIIDTKSYNETVSIFNSGDISGITGDYKIRIDNNASARPGIDNLSFTSLPTLSTNYVLNNVNVGNVTSYDVTGLEPGTKYFYLVRAVNATSTSTNSEEISATTLVTSVTWDGLQWSNITGPDETLDAIIDGNLTMNTDLTAKSLTMMSGILTVASNTTLTVENEIVNTLGVEHFIVESDGVVLQTTTDAGAALATVKRNSSNLYRQDYTSWSSPVTGQNLRAFSEQTIFSRFYSYDAAIGTIGDYKQELFTTADINVKEFTNGQGYLIRMPNNWPVYVNAQTAGTPFTGVFTGILNNGNYSVTLSDDNIGFNLVGNPYPSPISISAFFAENTTIETVLYFWRKRNGAQGTGYATYSGLGTTSLHSEGTVADLEDTIKPGQGFYVTANAPTNLTFTNEMRTNVGETVFFKSVSDVPTETSRFWLNLSNATDVVAQTLVGYKAGATQGVDNGIDALYFNDSALALTSLINATEYSIQGRSLPFEITDVVPLGFKADVAGTFSISLANFDGLFAGDQAIFLKDNTNGTYHNLKTAAYTFITEIGVFNSRFEVQYSSTLGNDNATGIENKIVVGVKNQKITINAGTVVMEKVELIDVSGRVIYTLKEVNSTTATIENLTTANQLLIVRISTVNNGVVNQKIIF